MTDGKDGGSDIGATAAVPEPAVPEPAVPEPAVPEPAVPEAAVPEPAVPEPLGAEDDAHYDEADPPGSDGGAVPGPVSPAAPEAAPHQPSPPADVDRQPTGDGPEPNLAAHLQSVSESVAELARLRVRDTDLIGRLHDEVTRLRAGELAAALTPVVNGLLKLHDQMVSLGALADPASIAGLLHRQLLQTLELTCGVRPFTPDPGDPFDPARHAGIRRVPTADPGVDGTVAATVKAGFVRLDSSLVRVADVEVKRLSG